MFYREKFAYNTVNYRIDLMAAGLRSLGVSVDIFDLFGADAKSEAIRLAQSLNNEHYDAAYTVDAVGQQDIVDENGDNIFDRYHIPFFNRVLDPPYFLDLESKGKNYYILFTDKDYIEFTKKYYRGIKDAFFLPHFASSDFTGETVDEFAARRYPVVFTGTYESIESMMSRLVDPLPPAAKDIFSDALDILLDERDTGVEDALIRVFTDRTGEDLTVEKYNNIRGLFSILNVFTRQYLRGELLNTLAVSGIPLHIWGSGTWEDADWLKNSEFVYHGNCPAEKVPEIYRQSRIVLNCFPCFKAGSHDRLPFAMMNGAAVMTDRNRYTDGIEGNTGKFIFYDISHTERAPGILFDAIDDPVKTFKTASEGWKYASEYMTAEHAAGYFLELLKSIKADG